ncbi:MAG: class I SAM-dependent methyltransferase, partial [Xanthobacteraceae bacterium]
RRMHIVPDSFYYPIPNIREIEDRVWSRPSAMVGIASRIEEQRALLDELSVHFDDFAKLSDARQFDQLDGAVLFAMLRCAKPAHVIEIGAGSSTLCMLDALGPDASLTSIDPYPPKCLAQIDDARFTLMPERVEDVPIEFFETLEAHDVLFIDSSHVVKTGSDVLHEVLEILPRMKVGTLIHIHDIFLPNDYPKAWLARRTFWTEQYLVQAFLAFNNAFKILWSSSMMAMWKPDDVRRCFGTLYGGSLWLERVS